MSLVSKAETVRSIAAQYGGSVEGTKAIAWAKKQPVAYFNVRGDVWAEHLAEEARGEEGELTRAQLADRCIGMVASEIVECGLADAETD